MLYGIYRMKQILDCSGLLFGIPDVDMETMKKVNEYDLKCDFIKMYNMLSEIKEIIDKMMQEDENINIGKLMADQEGENNELQRSTGTEI